MNTKVGDHIQVSTTLPFKGGKHPQAGKRGMVTEIMSLLIPVPRAMIRLDPGQPDAGRFIVVTLSYLEQIETEKEQPQ